MCVHFAFLEFDWLGAESKSNLWMCNSIHNAEKGLGVQVWVKICAYNNLYEGETCTSYRSKFAYSVHNLVHNNNYGKIHSIPQDPVYQWLI
jgi:hypothetical protein